MGVRLQLTITYDWDTEGDEISALDLQQETQDWIIAVVTKTSMLPDDTNPLFNVERVKP